MPGAGGAEGLEVATAPAVAGLQAATAPKPQAAATTHLTVLEPGSFCAELWASIDGPAGLFSKILAHPFLAGLADGSLPEATFRQYITQDVLYLREYGRALAAVAARAPRPAWTAFMARCASEAIDAELGSHQLLLAHFNTSLEAETAGAEPSPNCLLYTSFVLAAVHERPFYEGLAAVLPCFLVYLEVGRALIEKGSPHPAYAAWIDKYGGGEFGDVVAQACRIVNEVAAGLGEEQRDRMRALFRQGCRLEYLFWDGAWQRQGWPV